MGHGAWSMEHGAWGMGHGAWGMEKLICINLRILRYERVN